MDQVEEAKINFNVPKSSFQTGSFICSDTNLSQSKQMFQDVIDSGDVSIEEEDDEFIRAYRQ